MFPIQGPGIEPADMEEKHNYDGQKQRREGGGSGYKRKSNKRLEGIDTEER